MTAKLERIAWYKLHDLPQGVFVAILARGMTVSTDHQGGGASCLSCIRLRLWVGDFDSFSAERTSSTVL